jgi:hypothetical protein
MSITLHKLHERFGLPGELVSIQYFFSEDASMVIQRVFSVDRIEINWDVK